MTKSYITPQFSLSEESKKKALSFGYDKKFLNETYVLWKKSMIALAQKKDINGLSDDWNASFIEHIKSFKKDSKPSEKKRTKIHNPATDPEENKKLNKKLEEMESIDMENSAKRLAKLRAEIGL